MKKKRKERNNIKMIKKGNKMEKLRLLAEKFEIHDSI